MNRHPIAIIVLILIIGGGWYLLSGTSVKAPATTETPIVDGTATETVTVDGTATTETPIVDGTATETVIVDGTAQETAVENTAPSGVTVIYTDKGFSPGNVTIPLGTRVTFVNQSAKSMWVASVVHPSHSVYSGTSLSQHCPDTTNSSFDECTAVAAGASYSFTFTKVGTWGYHNHVQAGDFGKVVVQ